MLKLRDEKCKIRLMKNSNFTYICEPLNPKGCPQKLRKYKLRRTCFIEV